jgi:hypothetical protein
MSLVLRLATRGIAGAAAAMFPENDHGAPDWQSTRMVERTLEWIEELPPKQGRLLLALFLVAELIGGVLAGRPRCFSRLALETRERAVRSWRASRWHLLRMLGDSLKASLTMMYASHPAVVGFLGEHRSCAHPADEPCIPVVPGALAGIEIGE